MRGHKWLKDAIINFDSPLCVFYPGQKLTGTLEVELDSPLTFSVIYIKFIGEATVKWIEQDTDLNVEYSSREVYFKGSELLAGSYGTVSNLNAGKYSYPFYYQLPIALPSSFKGSRGAVKFYASGHVEFEGKNLLGGDIIKPFEVVAPFDLNKGNAAVRESIEMDFEEVFSCGCFGGEPVSVQVRVPFSAYCPGQVIPVQVRVDNNSSVEITSMLFDLLTRSRYKSQRPIAEYVQPEEVMSSAKRGCILSGTQRNFEVELKVPDFIAPNLEMCSVIDVGYFIRVTIKVSGGNEDLQDETEICLGFVPLKETVSGTYTHPMAHSLPTEAPPDNYQPDARPELVQDEPGDANGPGFHEVCEQVITTTPEGIQIKYTSKSSYQIGFTADNAANPPTNSPGNTGSWADINEIAMKFFTPLSETHNATNLPTNSSSNTGPWGDINEIAMEFFTPPSETHNATNSSGNTGQFPDLNRIATKCFTPPGVYPYPGQNTAPSTAPSAPPAPL